MSLGISLLCKLGLTEEEADRINDKTNTNYIFARDQGGIGYTMPKLSALPDLDSTFARLAAMSSLDKNEAPKIEIKPIKPRYFIPSRLKKKDVNSLSNEDLSSIFIQSNSMSERLEALSNNVESPRKKRHHRHNQKEEDQNSSNGEKIESPVVDDIQSNNNQTSLQGSSITAEENQSGEVTQKKHRRRHHRKPAEEVATENSWKHF